MPRKNSNGHGRRRPKGEGTVFYSESDKRWHGRITVLDPLDATGKRRLHVAKQTEAEVRAALADKVAEHKAGGSTKEQVTFGAWLDRWLKEQREMVKHSTYAVREGHVNNWLKPMLGTTPIANLTFEDIERVTAAIVAQGRSARTSNHVRATARLALKDAKRAKLVRDNAAAEARSKPVEYREMQALSGAQVRSLIERAKDDDAGQYAVVWPFLCTTGLRLGEALALDWDDIDLDTRHVTVTKNYAKAAGKRWEVSSTKTDKSRRSVPFPASIGALLKAQAERVGTDVPVFPDELGRRPKPYSLNPQWLKVIKAIGVVPRTVKDKETGEMHEQWPRIHDARHSAGSIWLNNGLPITTVSRLLGHSNLNITLSIYGHLDRATLDLGADAMSRATGLD